MRLWLPFKRVLRQVWRGYFTLPYVGPHPGRLWALYFLLVPLLAFKAEHPLQSFLIWFSFSCVWLIVYSIGAYSRAQLSDDYVELEKTKAQPHA